MLFNDLNLENEPKEPQMRGSVIDGSPIGVRARVTGVRGRVRARESVFRLILLPFSTVKIRLGELKAVQNSYHREPTFNCHFGKGTPYISFRKR